MRAWYWIWASANAPDLAEWLDLPAEAGIDIEYVVAEKTRILFQVRRPFLAVSPRQMHLIGHFVFARRVPHSRFQKIGTASPGHVAHYFCLERSDELDPEFEAWVREAYAFGSAPD